MKLLKSKLLRIPLLSVVIGTVIKLFLYNLDNWILATVLINLTLLASGLFFFKDMSVKEISLSFLIMVPYFILFFVIDRLKGDFSELAMYDPPMYYKIITIPLYSFYIGNGWLPLIIGIIIDKFRRGTKEDI